MLSKLSRSHGACPVECHWKEDWVWKNGIWHNGVWEGIIHSQKFDAYIYSTVDPITFIKNEQSSKTSDELKKKVLV
jgi:hypothetical protein